jgi:UrcA family protein
MKKFAMAAALAAAASLLPAAPAAAEDFTVRISYADLDLATAAGAEQLGKRIEANAEAACGRPSVRDIKRTVAFEKCKDQVVAGAVEQLGAKGVGLAAL